MCQKSPPDNNAVALADGCCNGQPVRFVDRQPRPASCAGTCADDPSFLPVLNGPHPFRFPSTGEQP